MTWAFRGKSSGWKALKHSATIFIKDNYVSQDLSLRNKRSVPMGGKVKNNNTRRL
jgi:hypothetical protein